MMQLEGKRKYSLALLVLIGSFVLSYVGKLDTGGWVTIATLTLTIFGASNVVDKMKGGKG